MSASPSSTSQVTDSTAALNSAYLNSLQFDDRMAAQSATALPVWKRAIDLLCCLVALPFLGTVTLIFAVLLSVASPGPIIFRQQRVGHRGRRFQIYKFRTMHVNAATNSHQTHFAALVRSNVPMQKMDARGDARLVPGGWFLRATGLDELPQIINVLRGEMSMIGPRPCIPYEYEEYTAQQRRRFDAVPGLTGLWQVSGKNRTTFEQMIQLDIEYSQRRSLWLDLGIIVRTPMVLVRQCLRK
jgi:exopolysaccharide production protein ExoY